MIALMFMEEIFTLNKLGYHRIWKGMTTNIQLASAEEVQLCHWTLVID